MFGSPGTAGGGETEKYVSSGEPAGPAAVATAAAAASITTQHTKSGSAAIRLRALFDRPNAIAVRDAAFVVKFLEMRAHRLRRGRMEEFRHVGVNPFNDCGNFERSVFDRVQHLAFAQLAMSDIFANFLPGVANHGSVRRVDRFSLEREQPPQ